MKLGLGREAVNMDDWLDELDIEGESPRSRLLMAANAASTLLLGMLMSQTEEERAASPPIHQACRAGEPHCVCILLGDPPG